MRRNQRKLTAIVSFFLLTILTTSFLAFHYKTETEYVGSQHEVSSKPFEQEEVPMDMSSSRDLGERADEEPLSQTSGTNLSFESKIISEVPVGRVQEISIGDLDTQETGFVDLSEYDFEYFSFLWTRGEFEWGVGGSEIEPELSAVEVSDELEENSQTLISELYSVAGNRYIFVDSQNSIKDLKIHIIDPNPVIEEGYKVANDASGYNSGPKYSSLNIIPREDWSNDANINDPRVAGLCDLYSVGDPNRPSWCEDGDLGQANLTWEPYYYTINKIIVHHTATTNGADPYSTMRAIYNYHAISQGWGDIGYNYLIDQYGRIFEGKLGGDEAKGYHAGTANANSIGISMLGTFTSGTPTFAARDSLKKLIAEKAAFYDFTPSWHSNVYGHRDFQATACPGQALYDVLPGLTSSAASYKNTHFSNIKNVASQVNDAIDNGEYEAGKLILLFDHNASVSDLNNLFAFHDGELIGWNGIEDYSIDGDKIVLSMNYNFGTQSTDDRLRTLYKIFWLESDVDAVSLNFKYRAS